ncbi:methylmalonate-semialdehyde dehydrogenase (acylating) [Batrachochytrium salamandrivorans]|nr:methylmalonate-semialdehyde dehydrogenase (acylating) [Batrachochytrium salamandrivorans]
MPQLLANWVNNSPCPSSIEESQSDTASPHFLPVTNPACGSVIAHVPLSSTTDVNMAVASAQTAYESWSARTIKDRVQILIRFHQLVIKHSQKLADLIVMEHGKTFGEAMGEIAKGNETVEYAMSMPQISQGKTLEVSRGVHCSDLRKSLGVVVSIVPFNFPFMVPMWTLPIAVASGNTMVIKPSEKVPLTMCFVMELLKEAGLPDGVVNLVHGTAKVVNQLVDHPNVKAVTFVGTSTVAELIYKRGGLLNKRVIALGGAKNHLVAYSDRNLEMASNDIVASFTGCAGQRCMAASVLLTIGPQPDLLELLVAKSAAFKPGQAKGEVKVMGPVIDAASKSKILSYIKRSEESGARILLDGRTGHWESASAASTTADVGGTNGEISLQDGYWIGPTIILHTSKEDAALHDEIFGPVLSILQVASKEDAIAIENACEYGNAASIYTCDGGVAEWFSKRFSAGMIGVNIGVPVPREPFSFGGIGKSRFGWGDITGDSAVEFFSERRKVTTKWTLPTEQSWLS